MFTVYVLYSVKFDQIYIGFTSHLIYRFNQHQFTATKGHTIKFRPWLVIYTEVFEDNSSALKREKQLKSSRGRDFIRSQIIPMMISTGFISVS